MEFWNHPIIYRLLRLDEKWEQGIRPMNPLGGTEIRAHCGCGGYIKDPETGLFTNQPRCKNSFANSPFVSFSTSLESVRAYQLKNPLRTTIVEVDLSDLNILQHCVLHPLYTRELAIANGLAPDSMAQKFAVNDCEFLLECRDLEYSIPCRPITNSNNHLNYVDDILHASNVLSIKSVLSKVDMYISKFVIFSTSILKNKWFGTPKVQPALDTVEENLVKVEL